MARDETNIYCPKCHGIRACGVVEYREAKDHANQAPSARFFRNDHPDLQWFSRVRKCRYCEETFVTAELEDSFVSELVSLRNDVARMRDELELYEAIAQAANEAIGKLSAAIEKLPKP
jgi:hypothetical protein